MRKPSRRIVLAYSGGLRSSAAIPWLAEKHAAEIVAMTLDMGQGGEIEEVRDRALANGAVRAHVLDVRDELARDFIIRALKAGATADGGQPLVAALGRPVIAQKLAEVAAIEQATSIAHGVAQADEGGPGFDAAIRGLSPQITVLAPAGQWEMSRRELLEYAQARNLATAATLERPYPIDETLWGRSVDCTGADPWSEPPEELFRLTASATDCPGEPAYVEVAFERGAPTAVNGVSMARTDLIATISMIAGAHGVGRFDTVENDGADIRTRRICEAPAAVVLHAAHVELQ
jgi:argininosuccinate synthase